MKCNNMHMFHHSNNQTLSRMILTIDKLLINLSDINTITYRCAITEST
jgi:hypothetical protein